MVLYVLLFAIYCPCVKIFTTFFKIMSNFLMRLLKRDIDFSACDAYSIWPLHVSLHIDLTFNNKYAFDTVISEKVPSCGTNSVILDQLF